MAVELVNCKGRPVYVRGADGELVALREAPRPVLIESAGRDGQLQVAAGDGVATLDVAPGDLECTLLLPEPADGVMYLVDSEVLVRCAHRDDFVAAHSYSLERLDGESLRRRVLASVSRRLGPAAADTSNISAADLAAARDPNQERDPAPGGV